MALPQFLPGAEALADDLNAIVGAITGMPEMGSNANGNWAIFPTGLQVCWFVGLKTIAIDNAYGPTLWQGTTTFIFPRAFAAEPAVAAGRSQYTTGRSWAMVGSATATACVLAYMDIASRVAAPTNVSYFAIGMAE